MGSKKTYVAHAEQTVDGRSRLMRDIFIYLNTEIQSAGREKSQQFN